MLQRDRAVFAAVGFVQIHEWGCVNELAVGPIAKRLVGFRRKNRGAIGIRITSSLDESRSVGIKIRHPNRYACHRR
jgi:hypothetical protein